MKQLVFLVLVVSAATGGGYWLGQHQAKTAKTQRTETAQSAEATGSAPTRLPPVKSRISARSSDSAGKEGPLMLSDIEAKLLALRDGDNRRGRDYLRMLDSINPADIPHLLSVIEGHPSK